MSDEAAFLEALRANPADDTTRLVYADWLEERDRAQEAEYLRAVVALAQAKMDYTSDQPQILRAVKLAESLPGEWRTAAASRFKVVYYGSNDSAKKLRAIKAIREVARIGLGEAKIACEQPPSELLHSARFEDALAARDLVRDGSGGIVLVHPCEQTDLPHRVVYDIVASRWCWAERDDSESTRRSMAAFAEFLNTTLNITPDVAGELARNEQVTLAEHVEPDTAKARVAELSKLAPMVLGENDEESWGVWVQMLPTIIHASESA